MKDKIKGMFSMFSMGDDEYDYDEREEMELVEEAPRNVKPVTQNPGPRVVPMNAGGSKQELLNLTMSNYEMTAEISDYIKAKKPIVVNMQKLNQAEMQRAIDFLSGACIALNGSVRKVADSIFIFAPEHINVNQEDVHSARESVKRTKTRTTWPKA